MEVDLTWRTSIDKLSPPTLACGELGHSLAQPHPSWRVFTLHTAGGRATTAAHSVSYRYT